VLQRRELRRGRGRGGHEKSEKFYEEKKDQDKCEERVGD